MVLRIIKLIISIFYYLYILVSNFLTEKKKRQGIILLYHGIPKEYKVQFQKQLGMILKFSCPVPADYIKEKANRKRYVAITFDDGHRNIFQNVFPEIEKKKIPITLFIPTGFLDNHPGWYSKERDYDEGMHVMSTKELNEMNQSQFVTIGSHSITHSYLPDLEESEIKNEIFQSKKDLESILNESIHLFSFPHGEFNNNIVSFCKQTEYTNVYSILPVPIHFEKDEFVRGRIDVDPWDWSLEFYLKLIGAYFWLPRAFDLKRRILHYLKSGSI